MKKVILIMLILLIPLVYSTKYEPSKETNCVDRICSKTLYSGTIYANDKGLRVEEASSLKINQDWHGIKCVVKSDNIHLVECLDYNYTHRRIIMSINPVSLINKKSIQIKIMERNINGTLIEKSRTTTDLTFEKEKWIKVDFNNEIHIGEKSTTIELTSPNNENLDDTWVDSDNPDTNYGSGNYMQIKDSFGDLYFVLIKFNISSIPLSSTILDSLLRFTAYANGDKIVNVTEFPDNWVESVVTYNNKPTGGASLDTGTVGAGLNVTTWIATEHGASKGNASFLLDNTESGTIGVRPKEYATVGQRPFLNITYQEPDTTAPTVTVTSPVAKTYPVNENNITIDFTATDDPEGEGVDDLWFYNGTDNTSYTDGTPQYVVLINNDYNFIFYANDSAGNLDSENVSFTVGYDVERFIFNVTNVVTDTTQFYVKSNGEIGANYKIVFANLEEIHNTVDGWITIEGGLNVTKNVTAENVFLPQYIYSHTNETIPVVGANLWTNITFSQEDTEIKQGITHTYNDETNHTFTVAVDGIYDVDYDLDVEDTSAGASDIDVAARLVLINGTEVKGSVFEADITKQGVEVELSHNFLVSCKAGEEFIFQFAATDADVQISTHNTFGDYPESATVLMMKIANLP